MEQPHDEMTQQLAERWGWQVARRDDPRIARRLSRQHLVDGVSRGDDGALLDDFVHSLQAMTALPLWAQVDGTAIPRERLPVIQPRWLDGRQPRLGLDRMTARPPLLLSAAALMPRVGCKARQVRPGLCPRGAALRQGERPLGPLCPDTLAKPLVTLKVRDSAAVCKGALRAVAKAGGFGATVTGMADGTALEPPARSTGGGQVTRQVRLEATRGRVHALEVTAYGWTVRLLIAAVTKSARAVQVGPIQAHEPLSGRALVTPARTNRGGHARRHEVVGDRGLWDGTERWGPDQHGSRGVVPAHAPMAGTADARAPAAAGEGSTVGRRGHPVRQGQGQTAWTARREAEVVGITGLPTDDQYGPAAQGRGHHRRHVQATPIKAGVVRQWAGRGDGPGGKPVFLTNAPVDTPLRPCDGDAARRLLETCGIKATPQPWDLGPPPQQQARAVRVPVLCTLLLCALATASRLQCEPEAMGGAPVGGQRWRRQRLEQTRDRGLVFVGGASGIAHRAADSLFVGVKLKNWPPGIGTRQDVFAKYQLTSQA